MVLGWDVSEWVAAVAGTPAGAALMECSADAFGGAAALMECSADALGGACNLVTKALDAVDAVFTATLSDASYAGFHVESAEKKECAGSGLAKD
jgi:hypothetical protein